MSKKQILGVKLILTSLVLMEIVFAGGGFLLFVALPMGIWGLWLMWITPGSKVWELLGVDAPSDAEEEAPEWQKDLKKLGAVLDNASGGLLATAKESAPSAEGSAAPEETSPNGD